MKIRKLLLGIAYYFNGRWDDIYKAIKTNNNPLPKSNITEEMLDKLQAFTILEEDKYPSRLKQTDRPPFALFYKGDISLLKSDHILAVVGSRENSDYGKDCCNNLLKNLKPDTVIVSGLAKGIDTYAHTAALKNGYKTIAVLGSGIDNIYPQNNRDLVDKIIDNGGLVISEYPGLVEPEKENFIARNRIIAGLCSGLLLVESYGRSGALNTCLCALNCGRNIGCVPTQVGKNSNCNRLIKEGALLIENSSDVDTLF